MSLAQRNAWFIQCCQILQRERLLKKKRKQVICYLITLMQKIKDQKTKYKMKSYWVHPLFQLRRVHGFYEAILPTVLTYEEKCFNYLRMTGAQFEKLLRLVEPSIAKQNVVRKSISATARLSMTLRYLATGDSMSSISYQYLVGLTTVSNIIQETCQALWDCLHAEMLPYPLTTEDWLKISEGFENQWNFNHCIGAIDGKHVMMQCPDNAGSSYFNYKLYHSIVLLAICDANYMFTFVDIGAFGRRSDGGIFRESLLGRKFEENKMNLPQPEPLTVDGNPMPYTLVGDEAFQLTHYLMRPYPGRGGLNQEKNIFNYRLSRARRTIENAFGILVSRWRILKKPIEATVENTTRTVQAIVCLHNWIRKQDDANIYIPPDMVDRDGTDCTIPGFGRQELVGSALEDCRVQGIRNFTKVAAEIREEFCQFFNAEGAVPWQYNRE